MKRFFAVVFSTACSISLSFIATSRPAFAASETGGNNSFATRQFLPSGTSSLDGQLEGQEVDFFTFSGLNPGNLFTAQVNSDAFDSLLGLLDDSGNILAINDDGADNNVLSVLTGKVPESGALNFGVSGLRDIFLVGDHFESGSYALAFNSFTLPTTSVNPTTLNGGFENGNFTGWTILGETNIETEAFNNGLTQGSYQALLSTGGTTFTGSILEEFLGLEAGSLDNLGRSLEPPIPGPPGNVTLGSAIQQTFTAKAGEILTFDWNFLTNEAAFPALNDFSFVSISPLSGLGSAFSTSLVSPTARFSQETGFQTFSFTIPTTGVYSLGIGVIDWRDDTTDSGLLIDNVKLTSIPEPTSVVGLLAFGALGASSLQRRKLGKKRRTLSRSKRSKNATQLC